MTLAVTVNGTAVTAKDGLQVSDALNQRSTCSFVIEEAAGTTHFQNSQTVSVVDSVNGTLFAGFVDQGDENRLMPNTNIETNIACKDNTWLADKRRVTSDYANMAAGDIVTDMASRYLAVEGITAGYAYKRESTQADFNTGTLTGVSSTLNVGDGDLELSSAGTTVTSTTTTTANFSAGTRVNTTAANNSLVLSSMAGLQLIGTASQGVNNPYCYIKIWVGSYTVAAGDTLNYQVWINKASPQIKSAVDGTCSDGSTIRDFNNQGIVDQNTISAHPGTDLSGFADNQWYLRTIDLTALAGKSLASVTVALEGDNPGLYTTYFRDIKILNSIGALAQSIFATNATATQTLAQSSLNGYSAVALNVVTVYESSGTRVSPNISVAAVSIAKTSIISWIADVTPPVGTSLNLDTSMDGGATWQPATNHMAIPSIVAGMNLASKNLQTRVRMNLNGNDPNVTPTLTSIVATVQPSYTATKTDVQAVYGTAAQFNTGAVTNALVVSDNVLTLNGAYKDWHIATVADQTLYGSGGPAHSVVLGQGVVTNTGTNLDVRSRLDAIGQWSDFTAEVDIYINAFGNYGLVYRTTGWQNLNDTYAYSVYVSTSQIVLAKGTNLAVGPGLFTAISTVGLTLASGSWHRLKIVTLGTSHKIYLDDVLYINTTDAFYTGAGYFGLRFYNQSGATHSAFFDNFGVCAALTGTWRSPAISLGSVGIAGNSAIFWNGDTTPVGTSLLVEASFDLATWYTIASGGSNPVYASGTTIPGGTNIYIRATLTAQNANVTPTLYGASVLQTAQLSATGNRTSPSLSLSPVSRAGSTFINWTATLPNGSTTLGVDVSTNGGSTWTDVTANLGGPLPTSIIYPQPDPYLDFYGSNTSANYTSTFFSGGAAATWNFDTANNRLVGTQASGIRGLLRYDGFSRADMAVEADFNYSDSGGLAVRSVDTSNLYFITIRDSASSSNANQLYLRKMVAGTITVLQQVAISFTRGDYHRFRLDAQGSTITVYMDNVQVIQVTDTGVTAAGKAGLIAGLATADKMQALSLRVQPYGDTVSAMAIMMRQRLATTDPVNSPQVLDLTLSVHDPNIGNGATIASTAYASVGQNMNTVSACFDDLAKQSTSPSQFVWQIGKDKKLYFHQQQALAAPFYVYSGSSGAANGTLGNILFATPPTISRPDMLYRNRQNIDGGIDVTSTITYAPPTDGFTQSWPLAYPVNIQPLIVLNSVVQTVGIAGTDTGKAFYWQLGSNIISQDASGIPPAKFDKLSVQYVGQIPVRVTRNNTNGTGAYAGTVGQTQLAAIDGSSGIVEDYQQIAGLTKAAATAAADALLNQYGKLGITWTFTTLSYGLAPGQVILATVVEHGIINQPFLVTKVTTTTQMAAVSGGILYWYAIECTSGPVLRDWELFFVNMGKAH